MSDILIKGMELPKEGAVDISIKADGTITSAHYRFDLPYRAIELPSYIELKNMFNERFDYFKNEGFNHPEREAFDQILCDLKIAPSVVEASKRLIDIKSLENFSTTIDDHPFTGERILKTPITVRLRDIPENWFSETSLLGSSKSDFYNDAKSDGLFREKTYNCIGVYGYGDVFDLLIKMDSGKVEKFFSSIFEQVPIVLEASK